MYVVKLSPAALAFLKGAAEVYRPMPGYGDPVLLPRVQREALYCLDNATMEVS